MKAKLVELVFVVATAVLLLGGYYAFELIRAHVAMDRALLQVIQSQGKAQAGEAK